MRTTEIYLLASALFLTMQLFTLIPPWPRSLIVPLVLLPMAILRATVPLLAGWRHLRLNQISLDRRLLWRIWTLGGPVACTSVLLILTIIFRHKDDRAAPIVCMLYITIGWTALLDVSASCAQWM